MLRSFTVAAVCAIALLAASPASAMRCGTRLVTRGDHPARVLSSCGEPAYVSRRVESRTVGVHRRVRDGVVISDHATVSVEVEVWTYDFGPQRFVRELTFEDGRLVYIRTLGYGTPGREPADG